MTEGTFLRLLNILCGWRVDCRFAPGVAKRIETYGDFEAAMDHARAHEADMAAHSTYLAKHTTSARARELAQLLNEKGVRS